ncbi:protein tincar [Copidosoma floridanum]|uniref:protein tincar n=1 Tax=Copidosoma floridanum TaxID=29053 RepID=UPI000C6F70AA|nr:protein tincar [Copidosoma floridanum]
MSMSGSLMGYENNNDVHNHHHYHHHHQHQAGSGKLKKPVKALPVVTSVNAAGATSSSASSRPKRRGVCGRGHVNSLWSVWYGIIAVAFQAYIAARCIRRFIAFLSLPWPADAPPPKIELHLCLVLAATGILLLPLLLAAAFLKLGNLANDGIKLGRHVSTCSKDPPSALLNNNADSNGLVHNLWRHGGPTAAFVHLCTAMCFLLPSLLMEARLIHAGFLPKDAIWRTDLDWVVVHRDRLVVLSFMNIPENFSLSVNPTSYYSTSQPYLEDELDDIINGTNLESGTHVTTVGPVVSSSASSPGTEAPPPTFDTSSPTASTTTDRDPESTVPDLLPYAGHAVAPTPSPTSSAGVLLSLRRPASARMNARNVRNRPKYKKNNGSSRGRSTSGAPGRAGGNMSAQSLPLTFNSLADLDRPESLSRDELDETTEEYYGPVTLEYLNYAMALVVYTVRYPAVFWATNKALGTIFSVQLVANSAQSLLTYAGMSVLYKVQVLGPLKVLPLLRRRAIPTASALSNFLGDRIFLLNPHVTLVLFALSSLLVVICSSMVMYLYAYGRYATFLNQERERRVILAKESRAEDTSWTYITHPAALCVFLAIGICSAPLLYDYSVVYRGSLDGAVLACMLACVAHLGFWLMLWLALAVKRRWTFKVRVTIGRATVRSARSLKLVTDVDLMTAGARDDEESLGAAAPLLVVGNGRTYTVAETSPKKAIMGVIQKAAMDRKARAQGGAMMDSTDGGDSAADGDEQIYWLRPKLRPSPVPNGGVASAGGGTANDKGWLNKKIKQKVTFNDLPSTSSSRSKGKGRRGVADGGAPEDDGDYATLRELPLHELNDDTISEENKLLECVSDDQVTYYASGNRDLQPSEEEASPLSPEQPLPDPPPVSSVCLQVADVGLPLSLPPPTPTSQEMSLVHSTNPQITSGQTPRCLQRADSGMPHDELTPHSDSSRSPPLLDGLAGNTCASSISSTNNTEASNNNNNSSSSGSTSSSSDSTTSSGVHSNASSLQQQQQQRRATSVEDLLASTATREELTSNWRSCSLQRGAQPLPPPTSSSPAKFSNPGRVIANPTANYAPSSYASNNNNNNHHNGVGNNLLINNNNNGLVAVGGEMGGCPAAAVILENEATVVIRRKNSRPKLVEPPALSEEPFGRSTNMRMTSFTENNDLRAIQASSATLPHYPTQPVVNASSYPHCSTMPLPHGSSNANHGGSSASMFSSAGGIMSTGSAGSCGSVPRQILGSGGSNSSLPSHTTLPSHHNGVRLMLHNGPTSFAKRFPPVPLLQGAGQPWPVLPSATSGSNLHSLHHHHAHHTFPQALQLNAPTNGHHYQQQHIQPQPHSARQSDRDSANFSMASSGDSDTCLPH